MFRRFLVRVGIISDTFIFDVQGASFGTIRNRGSPHRIVITTIHNTMADSPRSPPTLLSTLMTLFYRPCYNGQLMTLFYRPDVLEPRFDYPLLC